MLLTITCTTGPATDLGFLLHKHPARAQTFELAFGHAHVFYPEATEERCTAALLLDVDPVGLIRGRGGPGRDRFSLDQYVNDRSYVASSFLSVAIAQVYGTALAGRCNARPELVERPLGLEARIAVLPCRGEEDLLHRLFEPLGYGIESERHVLDSSFTDWGDSPYRTVALRRVGPLHELLGHLYVLVPVLDNEKHYWVGDDELEKLLRHGEGWLGSHPEREAIVARYLKHQSRLTRAALSRLAEEDHADPDAEEASHDHEEEAVEERISLHTQRLGAVLSVLKASGAHSVLDLGCGEGKLVRLLAAERQFNQIVGVDVSHRALQIAAERLRPDRRPSPVVSGTTHADAAGTSEPRIRLLHGSLAYRDQRLKGFDAAAIVEVIEHLDPPRLAAFERVVFEFARPRTVVLTTPNAEYNVRFETLPAGRFRHRDHRFEWTRAEFQAWARRVAERFGYTVRFLPVGPEDTQVGAPTQMGVFEAAETAASR